MRGVHGQSADTADGRAPVGAGMQQKIADRQLDQLIVELDDVHKFNDDLAEAVRENTCRYQRLFADAVDELLPEPSHEACRRRECTPACRRDARTWMA